MKMLTGLVLAAALIASSCSRGVVSPGSEIRGSFPKKTHTLADAWEGSRSVLIEMGRPVAPDVYTEVHSVSGSGIMVIDVRSHDFDPVVAVIDGSGRLVAFNDNWKGTSNARIVLDGAPPGGRLLVFSPDDSRGLYDIVVREGTAGELETFSGTTDLQRGSVTSWLEPAGHNPVLENLLREALDEHTYNYNYSQAQLFPFTLEGADLVSISLESDDFDPYLVLMSVEDGEYAFVDYNDDYDGTWSRIVRELESGRYIAAVMPYSAGGSGEFTLRMESIDSEALVAAGVEADEPGVDHAGRIVQDRNLALAWWPGMTEDWEVPYFLDPFSPVAGFTFTVHEPAVYRASAFSHLDVCLTLLRRQDGSVQFIASNDDYIDMGTDSRVVEFLMPGEYAALVSAYGESGQGEVTFSWTRDEAEVSTLRTGRRVTEFVPYETENLIFRLDVTEGRSHAISVESQELDPVITLYMPDGEVLYDDDGGEGTNSLLTFTVRGGQAGTCFLVVGKYYSDEGTFIIDFD